MIPVRETSPGVLEPLAGNPVLLSLDGQRKATLRTIMAPSWTAEARAKFGVHLVAPVVVPAGKAITGAPRYERRGATVVQVVDIVDAPPAPQQPDRYDALAAEVAALAARVAALEAKRS